LGKWKTSIRHNIIDSTMHCGKVALYIQQTYVGVGLGLVGLGLGLGVEVGLGR